MKRKENATPFEALESFLKYCCINDVEINDQSFERLMFLLIQITNKSHIAAVTYRFGFDGKKELIKKLEESSFYRQGM